MISPWRTEPKAHEPVDGSDSAMQTENSAGVRSSSFTVVRYTPCELAVHRIGVATSREGTAIGSSRGYGLGCRSGSRICRSRRPSQSVTSMCSA